ncbi:endoplasmic reticulum protein [Macrolepiota fuliginosa MF-IS2]|uniref:Endoplasmic reticulum protein n=1 Tax=Macrolepiota fuliginosa MF-IS2 TaxID=1400762 RepID=A0A9P5X5Q7_9AGAR|nr:endoplasmic reticulum protein [Macrolepiota fuliginosa MF-IS2]
MDGLFAPLASALGASVDQIKLIFCLLVAYPLGSLFVRVPSSQPALRHLFSVSVAVLFFFPVLKIYSAFFQLLASILATYYIAKYDKSKKMPWLVFFVVMGHLTVNHIIRALKNQSYETMEVTGPQMVLTMKLTTFAWNVFDGRRPTEDLDKWQMAKRVTKYPSLLEFLGYSFYFPGILVGPFLDYTEYTELVHETIFKDPSVKGKHTSGRMLPPGRKRAAYTRMILGLLYLGAFVVVGSTYNFAAANNPEFAQLPYWRRFLFFQTFGPLERAKYYAIWTLTEGASILTGLGFTGFSPSGSPNWTGAANVKVLDIEFPSNFKLLLDSWNMKTNIWLRECVYKRVATKGKKPGNKVTAITFFTSAFWHGIASGYYMTFFMGALITSAARLARASFRPLFLSPSPLSSFKSLYDIVGTITALTILNYSAAPFIVSTYSGSIGVWRVLGWYGHIVIVGGLVFFYIGGSKWLRGLQKSFGVLDAGRPTANGNGKASSSGTATPLAEKNFVIPPGPDKLVAPPS